MHIIKDKYSSTAKILPWSQLILPIKESAGVFSFFFFHCEWVGTLQGDLLPMTLGPRKIADETLVLIFAALKRNLRPVRSLKR